MESAKTPTSQWKSQDLLPLLKMESKYLSYLDGFETSPLHKKKREKRPSYVDLALPDFLKGKECRPCRHKHNIMDNIALFSKVHHLHE